MAAPKKVREWLEVLDVVAIARGRERREPREGGREGGREGRHVKCALRRTVMHGAGRSSAVGFLLAPWCAGKVGGVPWMRGSVDGGGAQ